MNFSIREATKDDLKSITDLWIKLSYDQLSKDEYYKESLTFDASGEQFINALEDPRCCIYVAEMDNSIVSFVEVWLKERDFYFFADDYAYILHFFVETSARKTRDIYSIIYRMYKVCENWALSRGSKYIVADAFSHNQRMMAFMQKFGLKNYRSRFVKPIQELEEGLHEKDI
jgi:hypothetical protein